MKVYLVYVLPLYTDGVEDESRLHGIYSTPEKAETARAEYMEGLNKDAGEKLSKDYFTWVVEHQMDERII